MRAVPAAEDDAGNPATSDETNCRLVHGPLPSQIVECGANDVPRVVAAVTAWTVHDDSSDGLSARQAIEPVADDRISLS